MNQKSMYAIICICSNSKQYCRPCSVLSIKFALSSEVVKCIHVGRLSGPAVIHFNRMRLFVNFGHFSSWVGRNNVLSVT